MQDEPRRVTEPEPAFYPVAPLIVTYAGVLSRRWLARAPIDDVRAMAERLCHRDILVRQKDDIAVRLLVAEAVFGH